VGKKELGERKKHIIDLFSKGGEKRKKKGGTTFRVRGGGRFRKRQYKRKKRWGWFVHTTRPRTCAKTEVTRDPYHQKKEGKGKRDLLRRLKRKRRGVDLDALRKRPGKRLLVSGEEGDGNAASLLEKGRTSCRKGTRKKSQKEGKGRKGGKCTNLFGNRKGCFQGKKGKKKRKGRLVFKERRAFFCPKGYKEKKKEEGADMKKGRKGGDLATGKKLYMLWCKRGREDFFEHIRKGGE